jgi:hypothetical protein
MQAILLIVLTKYDSQIWLTPRAIQTLFVAAAIVDKLSKIAGSSERSMGGR